MLNYSIIESEFINHGGTKSAIIQQKKNIKKETLPYPSQSCASLSIHFPIFTQLWNSRYANTFSFESIPQTPKDINKYFLPNILFYFKREKECDQFFPIPSDWFFSFSRIKSREFKLNCGSLVEKHIKILRKTSYKITSSSPEVKRLTYHLCHLTIFRY